MIQDLGLRFEGFVERQVPVQHGAAAAADEYEAAGLTAAPRVTCAWRPTTSCARGRDADALAAELDTRPKRRRYIAEFYGHRFWATPGAFTPRTSIS